MSEPPDEATAAEAEAADWFARLGTRTVSAPTLDAFQVWRSRPENAAAYRRLESVWSRAGDLKGDGDIERALASAAAPRPGGRRASKGRSVGTWLALAGATACVLIGASVWWQGRGAVSTGVGEQRLVQLEDGSTIRLDTASRVRVRFGEVRRGIELERGRAFFTVAHDAARPFLLQAGSMEVTAVGTAFDVRRDAAAATVTVVSGAVDVAVVPGTSARPTRLAAGQQMVVSRARRQVRAVDAAAQTGWTDGRLVFRDTALDAAVAEVNRYLTDKIELEAGSLDAVSVNGVFRTGDRDAFVAAASDLFGLEAAPAPDGSVRLIRPANNSGQTPGSPRS